MTTFIAPATFDWICAALACPRCGTVAEDPCAIDLQTKLAARPTMASLRVGDTFAVRADLSTGGYVVLGPRREPVRALEAWSCPTCAASGLWAIVEVCDGVLTSVSAAALDGATLDAIDIVSGEVLALIPLSEIQTVPRLAPDALRARLVQAERDRGGDAR